MTINDMKNYFVCDHLDRKHYAKKMCHSCYHRKGKSRMAHACEHKTKPHYSNGMCQTCYLAQYYRRRKQRIEERLQAKQGSAVNQHE